MIGRARSSSVNPMALRMPRAGARSGPSVRTAESRLEGSVGRSQSRVGCESGRGASFPRCVIDACGPRPIASEERSHSRPSPPGPFSRPALSPNVNPVDFFWTVGWVVPEGYPTGTVPYTVNATAKDGRTGVYEQFKVALAMLTVTDEVRPIIAEPTASPPPS